MNEFVWLMKRAIFHIFNRKIWRTGIFFKNSLINVKRAPEPSDVLWENLAFSNKEIVRRRTRGYALTFVMLCFSFLIIVTCTYLEGLFEVFIKGK
jgi:hypothetical protein